MSHEFVFIPFSGRVSDGVPTFHRQKKLKTPGEENLEVIPGVKVCPVTILIEFIRFCGMQQKIHCPERWKYTDVNLVHFFGVSDHGGCQYPVILVQGAQNSHMILDDDRVHVIHESIVIKVKGQIAVRINKVVNLFQVIGAVLHQFFDIQADLDIDFMIWHWINRQVDVVFIDEPADIQSA